MKTNRMPAIATIIALASFSLCGPAAAASFDCGKARAADERAICADRALNDLDVIMAVMLKLAGHFMAMGARGAMQDDQVAWLKARRACAANRACLRQSYDGRIATLQAVFDNVATHGPF